MKAKFFYSTPQIDEDNIVVDKTFEAFKKFYNENADSSKSADPYAVSAAYAAIYSRVSMQRGSVIRDIDLISSNYLVDTLISQISDDALAPDIGTNDILSVECSNDSIKAEIDALEKIISFDQLAKDITPEVIRYGEYTVKPEFANNNYGGGIVDLLDVVDQGKVVQLSKNGKIAGFLVIDEHKLRRVSSKDYIKFVFDGGRVRVPLEETIPYARNEKIKLFLDKLPKYVRVGRSIIHPLIPKIKELDLLEKLIPATKLSKLSNGTLIGMRVPEGTEILQAFQSARTIEGFINKKVAIDVNNELTVENILATTGLLKIIPLFGDKGSLEKVDYKSDEPDELTSSAQDLRTLICDSMGVPYELIYKSDGENKGGIVRRNSRYLRRLRCIQSCVASGIKKIIKMHLTSKGIKFKDSDILISFRNKLPEIENLNKLEQNDITISSMSSFLTFLKDALEEGSPIKDQININSAYKYFHDNFKTIGLETFIKLSDQQQIGNPNQRNITWPIEPERL